MDVTYNSEELEKRSQEFINSFKLKIKDVIDETIGSAYSDIMPYVESDTASNYREELRLELENCYRTSRFKAEWATNFRKAVFVENREEISKLIETDILERIKQLEDSRQEYECFRYTPMGDTYQCLKKENKRYREALELITKAESHYAEGDYGYQFIIIARTALTETEGGE